MTIEINVPMKCSTMENINAFCSKVINTGISLLVGLLMPFGVIALVLGIINFITRTYHDDTTPICLCIGVAGIIFGYMLWDLVQPFKFKCIQDKVKKDDR